MEYQLTVIVPVYNEEDNMEALESHLVSFLQTSSLEACVLFVDDGSKDGSLSCIKGLCNKISDFYYISLEKNSGLSAALKAGIDVCNTKYVGYIDADLQTHPEDFNMLCPYLPSFELVMGIRTNRQDSGFKKFQSKIANSIRRSFTHDGVSDTGCPLKVMHTDYAKRIPFFTGMHRFLPALIQLQHGRVKQVSVHHYPRVAGVSKYNFRNRLVSPFIDCFAFQWMRSRYINYVIKDRSL